MDIPNNLPALCAFAKGYNFLSDEIPAKEILLTARLMLSREGSWTKHAYSCLHHEYGRQTCIIGAWLNSVGSSYEENMRSIKAIYDLVPPNGRDGFKRITRWNDHCFTTHADVLDLLDRAIKSVNQKELVLEAA